MDEHFNTGPEPQQLEESDADNVKSSNLLPDECGILRNILVGMIYTYAERGAHMWTPLKFQDSDGRCPHCDTNTNHDPTSFESGEPARALALSQMVAHPRLLSSPFELRKIRAMPKCILECAILLEHGFSHEKSYVEDIQKMYIEIYKAHHKYYASLGDADPRLWGTRRAEDVTIEYPHNIILIERNGESHHVHHVLQQM